MTGHPHTDHYPPYSVTLGVIAFCLTFFAALAFILSRIPWTWAEHNVAGIFLFAVIGGLCVAVARADAGTRG